MSKVQLAGNASGTGIFTIASPNSNTDRTLTLPDNTGTLLTSGSAIQRSQMYAGAVLQVVTSNSNSYARVETTSNSYIATGYGVSITPTSATSKILVLFSVGMSLSQVTSNGVILAIARNTTVINGGSSSYGGAFFQMPTNPVYPSAHMSWLDSPATTSSVTYNLYGRSQNSGNSVFLIHEGSSYSLTVLEIAA